MMLRSIAAAGILIILAGLTLAAHAYGQCEIESDKWSEAFEALKKVVEDYRAIKDESVAPKINQIMSKGSRITMANAIQSVLKDRADRLAEAGSACQDAVAREKTAYENLRRCTGADRQRKNGPQQNAPATVSRERERLLAD
jgi:hypothetical protein